MSKEGIPLDWGYGQPLMVGAESEEQPTGPVRHAEVVAAHGLAWHMANLPRLGRGEPLDSQVGPLHVEAFRGAAWATRESMQDFMDSPTCQYPLPRNGAGAIWNALLRTHRDIIDMRPVERQGASIAFAGYRSLSAEQYAVFRHLPLMFVKTTRPVSPRHPHDNWELVLPSLYGSLRMVQDRPDRTEFFQGIERKRLQFLIDFTNQIFQPQVPLSFPPTRK